MQEQLHPKALKMFQREVERQCKFALMAYDDLREALRNNDMWRVWYFVQALIYALGNISYLLWPVRPRIKNRGAQLKSSLSVKDDSPLKARAFRDHFTHFDERLDEWALSSENHDYADSNVGITPGKGVLFWFAEGEYLRNIVRTDYPAQFDITFRGEALSLLPIMKAVQDLAQKAEAKSRDLPGRGRM
jgi:hypothetical protein